MAVKTAYKSKVGADYKISENFKLKEMACKDGTDKVLYSTGLMAKLEELRAYGGFKVHINSGYRTESHNAKYNGGKTSQHLYGRAADIKVYKDGKVVPAKYICCICQDLGFKGIAMIKSGTSTHVDMRPSGIYRGDETYGYSNNVGGNFYKYFGIKKATIDAMKVKAPVAVEQEDEEEMVYKTLADVPEWGKDSVQFRISMGITDGLNLTESMVRCWVIDDRENPYYANLVDVPDYWQEEVKPMLGIVIFGDGTHQISMRHSELKCAVIAWRIHNLK